MSAAQSNLFISPNKGAAVPNPQWVDIRALNANLAVVFDSDIGTRGLVELSTTYFWLDFTTVKGKNCAENLQTSK